MGYGWSSHKIKTPLEQIEDKVEEHHDKIAALTAGNRALVAENGIGNHELSDFDEDFGVGVDGGIEDPDDLSADGSILQLSRAGG